MAGTTHIWILDGQRVRVSSLERLYWPQDGLTKGDLLTYYREVADILLPYLKDRPVTLRLFPRGVAARGYYRRNRPSRAPAWLRSVTYRTESERAALDALLVDDAAGLLWLANRGAIELHPWMSRLPNLDEPDQAVFDLDPGDQADFGLVLRAAWRLHEELERLGLRAYPKTSGGRGLHVYLPLAAGHAFATVRAWVREIAERLTATDPELFALAHGSTHRGRQVTIDAAQNSMGRNTAAPYTVRAVRGATVSTPLTWEEVRQGAVRPTDFTLRTIRARLDRVGDLFAPVLEDGQRLPVA